ncbi:MAG: protein translocase subunit SecD [Verrucomicrobia bacterium]|nr:MAG: protein translocase subunit SecD [Verrucomicrobiota bacterium]TAE86353.1 MAG: protein translocase subunit SecD [Verrucomicrobiota bacterium]TAF24361.1 MAG: protein translocase subunit SecD [Verrucomicrobiota bacterium]
MFPPTLLAVAYLKDPMVLFLSGLSLLILFFWYFATDLESRKRNIGSLLILGLCAICTLALSGDKAIKAGIDLAGGSSFTLQVKPKIDDVTGQPIPLSTEDVRQAKNTVEKRLNEFGNIDMQAVEQGTDKILIQMPGMTPEVSAEIETLLQKVARLELRKVNPEGFQPGPDGRSLAERIHTKDEPRMPGFRVYEHSYKDRENNQRTEYLLLNNRVALTGKDVQQAWPESMGGAHHVSISLSNAGADKMLDLTSNLTLGVDRIAVVLDGKVITAPTVQAKLHKNFIIEGQESAKEARELSNAMMNPLENALEIIEKRVVSPTLGAAVVKQGVWAGIVGLSLTAFFVLVYYRTAGLIALFGLMVNTVIIFGGMAMFNFTFTLPGIAGMILSIGMAVDANVLIYERLREEIAAGKSLNSAIAASYEKAFTAIFDSNLTSLITAVILFWMGSGSIKGFAITLTIGIIASMFSAILVTRVLFRWSNDLHLLRKLSFLDLIKATRIDFLSKSKLAYIVSGILLLASAGAFLMKGEKGFGIDFTGGTLVQFQLGQEKLAQTEVEKALAGLQTSKLPTVQEETSITGELLTIRCATPDAEKVVTHLRESFPILAKQTPELDAEGKDTGRASFVVQQSTEAVSATLGKDFLTQSGIALALGLFGILIYITLRFEFSFALGGFIALLHDVILSAGLIVLFGGELSLIHVGALLTIAGYSINDTIVIFDRIRESLKGEDGDVKTLMNEAINATLSRTLLTSLTTIATVVILTIFGGAALKDFSAMILVGLVVGTYSSVFIASPVVLWWSQRKGGSLRKEILQTTLAEADIQGSAH